MKYSIGDNFKGVEVIGYDDDGMTNSETYWVKHVHPDPDTGKLPTCKPYMMTAEGLRKRKALDNTNHSRCKNCRVSKVPFKVWSKPKEDYDDIIWLDKIMPARPYKRLTGEIARK